MAALWVVLFHFGLRYASPPFPGEPLSGPMAQAAAWIGANIPDFGLLPVFWFFMISGFVIIWTLERCDNWQDFALSRAARLYPVYWAAVTLSVLVGLLAAAPWDRVGLLQFVVNLSMLQEIIGVPFVDGAYWSLTVELIFYAGAAAIFAFGWLRHLRMICLIWALGCVANHLLPWFGLGIPWRVQTYALLRYGHFLIAGIMFYQLWRGQSRTVPLSILGLCLLSISLAYPVGDTLICAAFFALFALAISGRLAFLATPPLLWLGAISYALYVSHQMIGYHIMAFAEGQGLPRPTTIATALGVVLTLSTLLTRFVERPARRAILGVWRQARSAASLSERMPSK